eukprot:TRINITY_DN1321_c0_g1_i1.p1 TRINITY_DN1321_c0_g1~~TRINITY_DN1321_c0_g1_i1.p1  ORF type:complete len:372 (-),score=84.10 TRINITY_DN1321_c0_g1_i1:30-1145(-)
MHGRGVHFIMTTSSSSSSSSSSSPNGYSSSFTSFSPSSTYSPSILVGSGLDEPGSHRQEKDNGTMSGHLGQRQNENTYISNFREALPALLKTAAARVATFHLVKKFVIENSYLVQQQDWDGPTKHDIVQRFARAIFASYFVYKTAGLLLGRYKERRDDTSSVDDESDDAVWSSNTPGTHAVCASFVGFILGDCVDLIRQYRTHKVVQADIWAHHVMGALVVGATVLRRRGQWSAIKIIINEVLVPVGVMLWWFKSSGQSHRLLKLIRCVGLLVIVCMRMPIFISVVGNLWVRLNAHRATPQGRTKSNENNNNNNNDNVGRQASDGLLWLTRTVRVRQNAVTLETFLHTMVGFATLKLDIGWAKLYARGLFE